MACRFALAESRGMNLSIGEMKKNGAPAESRQWTAAVGRTLGCASREVQRYGVVSKDRSPVLRPMTVRGSRWRPMLTANIGPPGRTLEKAASA